MDNALALAWLGQAYAAQGDDKEALRIVDQALALDSSSLDARLIRAEIYIDMQDLVRARQDLNAANQIKANVFQVYFGLGRVASLDGNSSEAWRSLTSALRLANTNVEYVQAYYWRALALEDMKQFPAAMADWVEVDRLGGVSLTFSQRQIAAQHLQNLTSSATPPTRTPTQSPTPTSPRLRRYQFPHFYADRHIYAQPHQNDNPHRHPIPQRHIHALT